MGQDQAQKIKLKSNYILMTSVSDEGTCMQHIKHEHIINQIKEKIINLEESEIYKYLRRHKSIPIYLNIEDSGTKFDQKVIRDAHVAKKYLSSRSKFQDNIFTFAINLTPYATDNVSILKASLERSLTKKGTLNTHIIASISKNKIAGFNVFLNNANLYIREKYQLHSNRVCSYIIATKEGYIKTVTCGKDSAILSKSFKYPEEEIMQKIKDEVDNIYMRSSRPNAYKDFGCDDGLDEVIIFSDKEEVLNHNFSTEGIKCENDTSYFKESFEDEGIMAFLSRISLAYKPHIILHNKDIATKVKIFKFLSFAKLLAVICILFASNTTYEIMFTKDPGGHKDVDDKKNQNMLLLSQYPSNDEKNKLDTLIEVYLLETINLALNASDDWQINVSKIAKVTKRFHEVQISSYNFECIKDCHSENGNQSRLNVAVDIGNENGYIHSLHFTITRLRNALMKEFGDRYEVSGLDFLYQFNIQKRYFATNLTFSIRNLGKTEPMPKHEKKSLIDTLFKGSGDVAVVNEGL